MSARYTAPKAIANHPGVLECLSGDAGGFDYKHDILLREGWQFTAGRCAGGRALRAHRVVDFRRAKPRRVDGFAPTTPKGGAR